MSPSFNVHGGQNDAKYVKFDYRLHLAFVTDTIWGDKLEPDNKHQLTGPPGRWAQPLPPHIPH